MNSQERLFAALNHREPDMVPLDFGSTIITGINRDAYRNYLRYLGADEPEPAYSFERSGLSTPGEEILQRLQIDTQGVWPNIQNPGAWAVSRSEDERYYHVTDHWGVGWKKPKAGGIYYDLESSPLDDEELTLEQAKSYPWPRLQDDFFLRGMLAQAQRAAEQGRGIVLENPIIEIFDIQMRLMGYENFYISLLDDPEVACYMMDRTLEIMVEYYRRVLELLKDYPLIVRIGDDLGSQNSLLISKEIYEALLMPRHRRLFDAIRGFAQNEVKIFLHCDGAIRSLIPDFIEIGVDILNPIQYTCTGMDPAELKREFGRDLAFWGAAVDTQQFLQSATPEEIREEVREKMALMAPGGGYVFSTIHNLQADVPPEKIDAIWKAAAEYRHY